MRQTNVNFDAKHDLLYKQPLYLIHFDGETKDFCNHPVGNPSNATYQYLQSITGASQTVTPEEGRSSIGGMTFSLFNPLVTDPGVTFILVTDMTVLVTDMTVPVAGGVSDGDDLLEMISNDATYFHRKKVTVKAGYQGMNEVDMLTIYTGWVTDLKLTADGLGYQFTITDPQKWMQRKIFRNAHTSSVTIGGNPIDVLLKVILSTGDGTNGYYDQYDEANGLGIDNAFINVSNIESVRDAWFSGLKFRWTISERIEAKKWIETEILKVLNCYPVIDADGKYNIKPFKPPLAGTTVTQSFDEDSLVGIPTWSMNLPALVNEVEANYDYDSVDSEYDTINYYIESTSLNGRGPGKKPIKLEAKGVHGSNSPVGDFGGDQFMQQRVNRIFQRFSIPPIKLGAKAFFTRWLSEAGDIVEVSHSILPDVANGVRGFTNTRMEIVNRQINWRDGNVTLELLDTGFARNTYCTISPIMTVTSGTSTTVFDVDDSSDYSEGWVINLYKPNMSQDTVEDDHTITDITGNQITVSPAMSATPSAGSIVQFSEYDNLTTAQKKWWALSDTNDFLGTDNDAAHLIVA